MPEELIGDHAGAAATHAEAAQTAKRILQKGGNAIDAAVAATLTLCVVKPGATGLGGYGGGLVYYDSAKRSAISINFDTRAPKGYRDEFYAKPEAREHGHCAMSVPGVVSGLDLAVRKFGTMRWPELCADAIKLAEDGFAAEKDLTIAIRDWMAKTDPISLKAYLPGGKIPEIGDIFRQRDLAKLLKRLAEQGPGIFYEGDLPRQIVKQVQAGGGYLAEEDFKVQLAHESTPLHVMYRGHDVYTPPLPCGGMTTLQILKTLDRFDFSKMEAWTPEPVHLFIEVAKHCWNDRLTHFTDPDFMKDPDQYLSDKHADEIAAMVRAGGVYQSPTQPPPGAKHTGNICCIDAQHSLCSLTSTHGGTLGSYVVIEGLGLVLNNGMSRFEYEGSNPNRAAPGKRVFHNMCPTVIAREHHPVAALGHVGGPTIVNITAEMAIGLMDFRQSAGALVGAPRLHTDGREPIQISPDFPPELAKGLEKLGHRIKPMPYIGGPPVAVTINHSSQQIHAASAAHNDSSAAF